MTAPKYDQAESARGYDGPEAAQEHWLRVCKDPTVCNANAYSVIIQGWADKDIHIDDMCRRDFEANGHCYCGKLLDGLAYPIQGA